MELVRYEAAKQAIANYKSVDEVKDFRDKAIAIEAYAKQANDYELEHDAAVARVRAERKCGQLLKETEKAKGGGDTSTGSCKRPVQAPKTLKEMGISKDQSSKWQQLAEVPEAEFENAINLPGHHPSTRHILKEKKEPAPRIDPDALWWWGRLNEIDKGKLNQPLKDYVNEMTDAMRVDASRIIPKIKQWINDYE